MDAPLKIAEILRALNQHGVEFVVVGGVASVLRGSPLMTKDVDVVYSASEDNIRRLAEALRELKAHYKDPAGRYIEPDVPRLASMKLHLLRTRFGPLDVLRNVGDGLGYDDLFEPLRRGRMPALSGFPSWRGALGSGSHPRFSPITVIRSPSR